MDGSNEHKANDTDITAQFHLLFRKRQESIMAARDMYKVVVAADPARKSAKQLAADRLEKKAQQKYALCLWLAAAFIVMQRSWFCACLLACQAQVGEAHEAKAEGTRCRPEGVRPLAKGRLGWLHQVGWREEASLAVVPCCLDQQAVLGFQVWKVRSVVHWWWRSGVHVFSVVVNTTTELFATSSTSVPTARGCTRVIWSAPQQ